MSRVTDRTRSRDTELLTAAARFPKGEWFTISDVLLVAYGYTGTPAYHPCARMLLAMHRAGHLDRIPPLAPPGAPQRGGGTVRYRWTED